MYRLLHTGLLVLFALSSYAQELKVFVVDENTQRPLSLAYVNVYRDGEKLPELTMQTNDEGVATINPEKYPCKIEVAITGYEIEIIKLASFPSDNKLYFTLNKKFASLNEVVVTGLSQPV